jgi:hypothetical protein
MSELEECVWDTLQMGRWMGRGRAYLMRRGPQPNIKMISKLKAHVGRVYVSFKWEIN